MKIPQRFKMYGVNSKFVYYTCDDNIHIDGIKFVVIKHWSSRCSKWIYDIKKYNEILANFDMGFYTTETRINGFKHD